MVADAFAEGEPRQLEPGEIVKQTSSAVGIQTARIISLAAVVLGGLAAASMWLYANEILKAHQATEAAAHGSPRGNLSDLYPRWLGARELLLHRQDPYSAEITRQIQAGYYGRPIDAARPNDPKDQQAFAYPLYVVFLLAPTVKLPFFVVQEGFFWLLLILTTVSVPLWMRVIGWRTTIGTQASWILLLLGCFPAVQGLKLQQLTLLVAPVLALCLFAVVRKRLIWAGILLAVITIKPQLMMLVALWLLIWALGQWRERQKLVWSFLISMAVLVATSEVLLPGWIGEFRVASVAYFQYTGGGRSVLDVLLAPPWGRVAASILVAGAAIFFWRVRRANQDSADFQWSLGLVLSITLLVIPMFAPYNQVLLLPAVMLIVRSIYLLWQKNFALRVLVLLSAISIAWPWLAAGGLVVASAFLPPATVQRAWALPLYTSVAIPLAVTAFLLAAKNALRAASDPGIKNVEARIQK